MHAKMPVGPASHAPLTHAVQPALHAPPRQWSAHALREHDATLAEQVARPLRVSADSEQYEGLYEPEVQRFTTHVLTAPVPPVIFLPQQPRALASNTLRARAADAEASGLYRSRVILIGPKPWVTVES